VSDTDDAPSAPGPSVSWVTTSEAWSAIGSKAELARTQLSYRVQSGTLVDANILVNLGDHAFSLDETCLDDRYDLRYTLTHELGHLFGLDHSEVVAATMSAKATEGDCEGRSLEADDLAGYCAIYPAAEGPEPPAEAPAEDVADADDVAEGADTLTPVTGRRVDDEGCAAGPIQGLALFILARSGRRAMRRARPAPAPSRARS
jgi:hypothetical protein